jgi:biotin transport system substrate-specific component
MKKKPFTTVELVMMAMFAALLCVSAYLSIPTPLPSAAHITVLNFMIVLIALVFEVRDSTIIIALWMILGAIGVPVFIGGSAGLGYLFGVFGGYTFSFIIASIVAGLIKGKKYSRIRYTLVAILAVVIIDIIGMIWWKFNGNLTWKVAILSGFVAFLPLDLIKAVIAAQVVPVFSRLLPDREENVEALGETAEAN